MENKSAYYGLVEAQQIQPVKEAPNLLRASKLLKENGDFLSGHDLILEDYSTPSATSSLSSSPKENDDILSEQDLVLEDCSLSAFPNLLNSSKMPKENGDISGKQDTILEDYST